MIVTRKGIFFCIQRFVDIEVARSIDSLRKAIRKAPPGGNIEWHLERLRFLSSHGYADADYVLAEALLMRDCAWYSPAVGLTHLEIAAEAKITAARRRLGLVLTRGLYGCDKSPREGLKWLQRAAAAGSILAIIELIVLRVLRPNQLQ